MQAADRLDGLSGGYAGKVAAPKPINPYGASKPFVGLDVAGQVKPVLDPHGRRLRQQQAAAAV